MRHPRFSCLILIATAIMPACRRGGPQGPLAVSHRITSRLIQLHRPMELSFEHHGSYRNPFAAADLEVAFTGPDGRVRRYTGFYFGRRTWMVRMRPEITGSWQYTYRFRTTRGVATGAGTFFCHPSDSEGPLRPDPANSYRWTYARGTPYFPLGIQDCYTHSGSQPGNFTIDGELRTDKARTVAPRDYFAIYGSSGFNLLRFSQRNCSYPLFTDLSSYSEDASLATDHLLALAQEQGFHIMFGFFGYHGQWHDDDFLNRIIGHIRTHLGMLEEAVDRPERRSTLEGEKRFIAYAVARWGVYVDFWELLNERRASDAWTRMMASYVQSIDPERKPVTTSWEKPQLEEIGVNAPHWYESENELESDLRVVTLAKKWKQFGKPVIVGEHGNTGMNWDSRSAIRMRIRAWTALFNEVALVFWNTSWSKYGIWGGRYTPGGVANIYLGPEERSYTRVLGLFSSRLPAGLRMVQPPLSDQGGVRAYGLISTEGAAAYLHHFASHATRARNINITLDLPRRSDLVARWIEPATGNQSEALPVAGSNNTFQAPPFEIDLALLVAPRQRR